MKNNGIIRFIVVICGLIPVILLTFGDIAVELKIKYIFQDGFLLNNIIQIF